MKIIQTYSEIDEVKAKVKYDLCSHLQERIIALEPYGLIGLWMNDGAYDDFHAGTIKAMILIDGKLLKSFLGYGYQANLWKSKLPRIALHRRKAKKSSLQASRAC